jgi:hypothetical protein
VAYRSLAPIDHGRRGLEVQRIWGTGDRAEARRQVGGLGHGVT